MTLTRKMLKAMGIEEEKIDQIIEAHSEAVEGLKQLMNEAKEKADKYDAVKNELDALKAKGDDGYKQKYEDEHKAYEEYKTAQTAKETKAAKEAAVKAYFESKNITGNNLDLAMMASSANIEALELADGKIKDTKALDELVSGKFAGLVSKTITNGAKTQTPPTNHGGGSMTREEIVNIKDAGQRQKAMYENASLFPELGIS